MSPDFFTLLEEQLVAAADRDPAPDRGRGVLAALPVAAALSAVALIAVGLVLVLGGEERAPERRSAVPPVPPSRVATKPLTTASRLVRVFVLNGTQQNGLAATVAQRLEITGATIVGTGTAVSSGVRTTRVYARDAVDGSAVQQRLGLPGAPRTLTPGRQTQAPGADVLVVLGSDYAPIGGGATGPSGAAGFPQQQINLNPPRGGKGLGFASIAEGGLALQAEHLPKSDLYAVYLYNSPTDALPLGFAQYDATSKHVAGAITTLPDSAVHYGEVVVTRQPGRSLESVGRIVLRGRIQR